MLVSVYPGPTVDTTQERSEHASNNRAKNREDKNQALQN